MMSKKSLQRIAAFCVLLQASRGIRSRLMQTTTSSFCCAAVKKRTDSFLKRSYPSDRRSLQKHSRDTTAKAGMPGVEPVSILSSASWYTPLLLSTVAGMSTSLGAVLVFFLPKKRLTPKGVKVTVVSSDLMCFSLSLAGSVMVTISVISLLPQCFTHNMTSTQFLARVFSIVLGCLVCKGLSLLFPDQPEDIFFPVPNNNQIQNNVQQEHANDHEEEEGLRKQLLSPSKEYSDVNDPQMLLPNNPSTLSISSSSTSLPSMIGPPSWTFRGTDLKDPDERKSWRIAMFLFLALLAHNFPEGLAVAASTAQSKDLGITVTVGIMIHNIPEGIAIAIPCMKARPNAPWLAFLLASISGLAEPLGAALTIAFLRYAKISSSSAMAEVQSEGGGLTILQSFISLEDVLAFVAGIMTMVALSELFPEARRHLVTSCSNRDSSSNNVTKPIESLTRTGASKTSFLAGTLSGIFIMLLTEWFLDS